MQTPNPAPRPDHSGRVIAICAVLMTLLVGYRQLNPSSGPARAGTAAPPTRVSQWPALIADRPKVGPETSRVLVLVFEDFECPACRAFTGVIDSLRSRFPQDVAILHAHLPLSYHRFAIPSARAAECARRQGRFDAFRALLYAWQDSLGLKSWRSFALDAGVRDLDSFDECVATSTLIPAVAHDTMLAQTIGARGTPTVLVNGWKWSHVPTLAQLDSAVRSYLGK